MDIKNVNDIAFDHDGNLWAVGETGAFMCDATVSACMNYTVDEGLADNKVNAVILAPDKTLWFGTYSGLSHYNGETWTNYTTDDGLVGNFVKSIALASDGALWFVTPGGISRFDGELWTNYTADDYLAKDYDVYSIAEAPDGALWFGTGHGVFRFDGVAWSHYTRHDGLAGSDIFSIAVAPDSALWFGSLHAGASRFDGEQWITFTTSDGLAHNVVEAIAVAPDGSIWFGTWEGVSCFDGLTWTTYSTADGLVSNEINTIEVAPDGALWFGTKDGISRFQPSGEVGAERLGTPPALPTPFTPELTLIPHLEINQPVTITYIRMLDESSGWALGGLQDVGDHVLHTSDGGKTWLDVTPPEPAPTGEELGKAAFGFFLDESTAWVAYHPAVEHLHGYEMHTSLIVWRTDDGGQSWESSWSIGVEFVGATLVPPYMRFVNDQWGWIMTRLGGVGMHKSPVYLLNTSDGGAHWGQVIDPNESLYLQSCGKTGMAFADEQTGWVTIDNCPRSGAGIEVTQDGGRTWDTQFLPPPLENPDLFDQTFCDTNSPTLFSPLHGALGVTCVSWIEDTKQVDNFLYVTEDGGQSWRSNRSPGGTPLFLNPDIGWALSRDLYKSLDGGESWTKFKTVNWDGQFSFVDAEHGWAVARTEDEIALVTTTDGGRTWRMLEPLVAATGESYPSEPCMLTATGKVTAYQRPSLKAEEFTQLPTDMSFYVGARTADGWIGFNPGVAQAANIGVFRYRWVQENSAITFEGDCEYIPVVVGPPPGICFTMPMSETPIYTDADLSSETPIILDTGDYAEVEGETEDGWMLIDLSVGNVGMARKGWMPRKFVNFNGPCDLPIITP